MFIMVKVNDSAVRGYSCWEDALSIWDPFFNIEPKHVTHRK